MNSRNALPATALYVTALLALAACGARPAGTVADEATRVSIQAATTGPAAARLHFHGAIASRDEMRLSFKVGGVIRRIAVEAGDTVRRGQLLAEIDQAEINAQVAQAEQLADKAERDLQRGERLRSDEVISLEQLQNLRTQQQTAAAQLRAVRFNQAFARITAPGDGTVLRRLAEQHELVPAGQAVLVFGTSDRGYVLKAAVADRELVQLRVGDKARVRLDAAPGQWLPATVSELTRAADPATAAWSAKPSCNPPRREVQGRPTRWSAYPPPRWWRPTAATPRCSSPSATAPASARCRSRSSTATMSRSAAASRRANRWSAPARPTSMTTA